MSSSCRLAPTVIRAPSTKVLILCGNTAVAERRQAPRLSGQPAMNWTMHSVNPVTLAERQYPSVAGSRVFRRGPAHRGNGRRPPVRPLTRFNFVACRAFETLHRPTGETYNYRTLRHFSYGATGRLNAVCDCVNGMTLLRRRRLAG